jgi:hypothetical protein
MEGPIGLISRKLRSEDSPATRSATLLGELIQIDGCEQVARWRWQLFNKRDVVVCELVATILFQALDTASRNA